MENAGNMIESLIDSVTDYGETSFELIKLKSIEKTSDVVSSIIPNSVTFILIGTFVLFLSLGLAFFIGEILSSYGLGFFIVAAFYGIVGIVIHFLMKKWIKKRIRNYINKQLLN
jgi:hypothetical protein